MSLAVNNINPAWPSFIIGRLVADIPKLVQFMDQLLIGCGTRDFSRCHNLAAKNFDAARSLAHRKQGHKQANVGNADTRVLFNGQKEPGQNP